MENLFVVYELDIWSRNLNTDFTLKNCLSGSVNLAKDPNSDKYPYWGYENAFDSRSEFSLPDGSMGKNVIIFWVKRNSHVHIDNKGKYIVILGEVPIQGLYYSKYSKYSINFGQLNREFWGSEFSSYETDLCKTTSHFELLTRKRHSSFELLTCKSYPSSY